MQNVRGEEDKPIETLERKAAIQRDPDRLERWELRESQGQMESSCTKSSATQAGGSKLGSGFPKETQMINKLKMSQ